VGDEFTVTIRESTGSEATNAVQANLAYDAAKLQFQSVTTSASVFTPASTPSGGGGTVTIAVYASPPGAAVVGNNQEVAKVTFKAIAGATSTAVAFASSSAIADANSPGDDLWDGNTAGGSYNLAVYTSQYAGQSAYPTVIHGDSVTSFLKYKNIGTSPWYDDTSVGGAPAGTKPVHLATSRPINRFSPVGTWWGGGQNRPTGVLAAVYEADGTTLASNQHIVQVNQIGRFDIKLFGPTNLEPGAYREFFQPIIEGGSIMNDPGTFLDVTVVSAVYTSQYAGQSAYPTIPRGSSADTYLQYKNTGNRDWYDDTSVSGAPAGTKVVHLASNRPINRFSLVGTWWGGGQNRPLGTPGQPRDFSAVYLA
ncbi:MAG TPA: cohesin domain-containing protein, partial [Candidatus Polarisedimenticolaceae bacterium]|nr:cohesin domain-containing protein [Candidatus Polarisedimenticolaceae bacterium]